MLGKVLEAELCTAAKIHAKGSWHKCNEVWHRRRFKMVAQWATATAVAVLAVSVVTFWRWKDIWW